MKQSLLKNRLLFLTPTLNGGGAEKNLINIINSLDTDFYHIQLVVFGGDDNYLDYLEHDINVVKFNVTDVKSGFWQLRSTISKFAPSLVFSTAFHVQFFVTILKLLGASFKNVYRVPTLPSNNLSTNLKGKILNSLSGAILRKCDLVICQTPEMKKEVIDLWGLKERNVISVRNLINFKQIRERSEMYSPVLNQNDYNLVAAGSLYSVKGFDILIRAISKVRKSIPSVKLNILGSETVEINYRSYLESVIDELDLRKNVTLVGYVSNPFPYYRNADTFVLSSIKEGFPNVVLEALALGTPVVVTNCVNFDGIVNCENGLVVEKNDVDSLANGIEEMFGRKFNIQLETINYDYDKLFFNLIKS